MDKLRAVLVDVLEGIALPARVFIERSYPALKGTDMERLRGDAKAVGSDFWRVIIRENGQATAKK